MSKEIPMDVLLEHAGSDYDDLPADVKAMVDEVESDLGRVGINVEADLAATEEAEAPVEAPASVTVTRDKSVPESFGSRGKARAFVAANPGYRVVDNGADADVRWTVDRALATRVTGVRTKTKKATTATAAVTPAAAERAPGKKETALAVYAELEAAGTLKRSNFLREMETRTGLSAKGASSYFYRIKGGKW